MVDRKLIDRTLTRESKLLYASISILIITILTAFYVNDFKKPSEFFPNSNRKPSKLFPFHRINTESGFTLTFLLEEFKPFIEELPIDGVWEMISENVDCVNEPSIISFRQVTPANSMALSKTMGAFFYVDDFESLKQSPKSDVPMVLLNMLYNYPGKLKGQELSNLRNKILSILGHEFVHFCQLLEEDLLDPEKLKQSEKDAFGISIALDTLLEIFQDPTARLSQMGSDDYSIWFEAYLANYSKFVFPDYYGYSIDDRPTLIPESLFISLAERMQLLTFVQEP